MGRPTLAGVTDGASNTLIVAENAARSQLWVKGRKVADVNPTGYTADRSVWAYAFLWTGTYSEDG